MTLAELENERAASRKEIAAASDAAAVEALRVKYSAIFHRECDMMNALPPFFKELCHRAVFRCGFKELQFGFTHLHEGRLYLLVFYFLHSIALESQH